MELSEFSPTKSFSKTAPFDSSKDGFPSNNILVAVRIRPLSKRERETPHPQKYARKNILRPVDKQMLIFDPTDSDDARNSPHSRRALGVRSGKDLRFVFDRVFDDTSAQLDVYENTTRYVLDSVFQGYNATVFAYGATGAGKTYTMLGNELNQGIISLTMIDLFNYMDTTSHEYTYNVSLSYLEVYNEQIRDLLNNDVKPPVGGLELRETKTGNVYVAGLSEYQPKSADEVLQLLKKGNETRVQFETAANSQSSRSHAVLQVMIEQTPRSGDLNDVKRSKLSLIDLAGSERAAVTKNRGVRLVEGANINKSLLALANCINALGRKSKAYVPYRDSKLTRLLKDSLGGNCRTIMIANVSPSSLSYEDTLNTLKYANRAKNIKTVVTKNVVQIDMHISKYKEKIDDLCKVVEEWKAKYKTLEEKCASSTIPVQVPLAIFSDQQLQALRSLLQSYVRSYRDGLSLESEYHKSNSDLYKIQLDQTLQTVPASPNKNLLSKQAQELQRKIEENSKQTTTLREQWRQCLDSLSVKYRGHEERQILAYETRVFELETSKLELEKGQQDHIAKEEQMQRYVADFINPMWKCMKEQWSNEQPDESFLFQKCMQTELFVLPGSVAVNSNNTNSSLVDDDSLMTDAMQEDSMEYQRSPGHHQPPPASSQPQRSALKRIPTNHPHYVHPNSPTQQNRPSSVPSLIQTAALPLRPSTSSPQKPKQIKLTRPYAPLTDRTTEKQRQERLQALQEARSKTPTKGSDLLPTQFTDLTQQWESVKNKKNRTVQQKVNQLRSLAKTESWSLHNKGVPSLPLAPHPNNTNNAPQQPSSPNKDEKKVRFADKPNYMKDTLSSRSRERFGPFTPMPPNAQNQPPQQQQPAPQFLFPAPPATPLSTQNIQASFSHLAMIEETWKDGLRSSLMGKENNPILRKKAKIKIAPTPVPSNMRVLSNK